jgi:hypothetical protein
MAGSRQIERNPQYSPLSVRQAYPWIDDEGAALIDTGGPGRLIGVGANDLPQTLLAHPRLQQRSGRSSEPVQKWSAW